MLGLASAYNCGGGRSSGKGAPAPDSDTTPAGPDRSSSSLAKQDGARLHTLQECCDECSPPQHLSFIPIIFNTSLRAAMQQQDSTTQAAAHLGFGGTCVVAPKPAAKETDVAVAGGVASSQQAADSPPQQGLSASSHSYQQHSLQLALEHSSADWQPQPLDTLVAVVGAPPGWLTDSSSFDFWGGGGSRLHLVTEDGPIPPAAQLAAPLHGPEVPTRAPKLCVTVSTVSSEIDSLAFPPLRMPAPEPAPAPPPREGSPTGLSSSRHLGEF